MLYILARPNPFFPQCRGIRIILQEEWAVQTFGDLRTNIEVFPARQVRRCNQDPVSHPDDTWNADTNACELITILPAIHEFENPVGEPVNNVLASSFHQRLKAQMVKQAAILIDRCHAKVGAAQVHTNRKSSHRLLFETPRNNTRPNESEFKSKR